MFGLCRGTDRAVRNSTLAIAAGGQSVFCSVAFCPPPQTLQRDGFSFDTRKHMIAVLHLHWPQLHIDHAILIPCLWACSYWLHIWAQRNPTKGPGDAMATLPFNCALLILAIAVLRLFVSWSAVISWFVIPVVTMAAVLAVLVLWARRPHGPRDASGHR